MSRREHVKRSVEFPSTTHVLPLPYLVTPWSINFAGQYQLTGGLPAILIDQDVVGGGMGATDCKCTCYARRRIADCI